MQTTTTSSPPEPEKNIIQQKYKLEGILGRGQFGTVCRGCTLKNGNPVAIKLENLSTPVNSLRHESTILRHLYKQHVSSIPEVYYYGIQDPYICLVMTFYPERSLAHYELEWEHIYEWWLQSCDILRHVHTHGIVHRDIKPAHFMRVTLDEHTTQWHLIDFGLATTYWDENSQHQQLPSTLKDSILGSPNWISLYIHQGYPPVRRDDYISLVYIFVDLALQTIDSGLDWLDRYSGFISTECETNVQMMKHKQWKRLQKIIQQTTLNEKEKDLFLKLLDVCSRLKFCDKPVYDQVIIEL